MTIPVPDAARGFGPTRGAERRVLLRASRLNAARRPQFGPLRGSLLLALLLTLLVCGCGGNERLSASDYKAHLATVAKESDQAQHAIEKGFQAKKVAQLAALLKTYATTEKRIGDEVSGLKAPNNAEAANSELAKGYKDTASETRAIVPKVEKMPSAKAAIAFLSRTGQTTGGRELDAALARLKKLGYIKHVS